MAFKKIVKDSLEGQQTLLTLAQMEGGEGPAIFHANPKAHLVLFDKLTKKYYTVKRMELRAEGDGMKLVTVLDDTEYTILES